MATPITLDVFLAALPSLGFTKNVPLKTQQAFVRRVEAHEAAIIAAETLLTAAPARKAAILAGHL